VTRVPVIGRSGLVNTFARRGGAPPAPGSDYPEFDGLGLTQLARWRNEPTLATADFYPDNVTPRETDPTPTGPGIGTGYRSRVTSGYVGSPPFGGPAVMLGHFDAGVAGGAGQGRMQYDAPGLFEFAAGWLGQFKSPYPHSDISNKTWLSLWGGPRLYIAHRVRVSPVLSFSRKFRIVTDGGWPGGNFEVDGTEDVVDNVWQRIGLYVKKDLVANTAGIIRLWVNGVQSVNLTSVVFPAAPCDNIYDEGENNGNYTQESPASRVIGYSPSWTGGSSGSPAEDAHNAAADRYTADFTILHRAA
jgi:hypothetical protein